MALIITKEILNESDFDVATYCTLLLLKPTKCNFDYSISPYVISDMMYGNCNEWNLQKINQSLNRLINNGYLDATKVNEYVYRVKYHEQDTLNKYSFIFLQSDELLNILKSSRRAKYSLLHLYLCILSTFDFRTHIDNRYSIVGHMSLSYISKISSLSMSTLIRNIKTLEDMKLLYVVHEKGLSGKTNIYGRYSDMDYIKNYSLTINN